MSILIIGGTGMLGGELARVFEDQQPIVWGSDQLDIADREEVLRRVTSVSPDLLINAAAYIDVDGAERSGSRANLVNGYGVGHLARAVSAIGGTMVHFSTDYVFRGDKREGYSEDDIPDPQSAYAKSKFLGEQELQKRIPSHYLIRLSRLFGVKGTGPDVKESFVDKMIRLSESHHVLQAVKEEVSSPTYAHDLAYRVGEMLDWGIPFGTYHVTNSGSCTWYEFAQQVLALIDWGGTLEPVPSDKFPRDAERPSYSILLNTKLPPVRDWREALKDYLITQGFI